MDPEIKALLKSIDGRLETMTQMLAVLANNNQGPPMPGKPTYYFSQGQTISITPTVPSGAYPILRS